MCRQLNDEMMMLVTETSADNLHTLHVYLLSTFM